MTLSRYAPSSVARRTFRKRSEEDGFTLIETLIVIVILGILAAVVVTAVTTATSQSVQAACRGDYRNVQTAVEAYKAQLNNYPSGSGAIAGALPHTDNDSGTAPAIAVGGSVGAAAANAAGALGSELMVQGNSAPNSAGAAFASVGPWLKDVPNNGGHYSIFVANDGSGHVLVLDGAGKVAGAGANSTYTQADCASVK